MPIKPRGPVIFQCDGDDCEEEIEGVPHEWWKADIPSYPHPCKRHYFFCSITCLVAFLIREGEAVVRPPRRLKEECMTSERTAR